MQTTHPIAKIVNRDGRKEDFDRQRIFLAIREAGKSSGEINEPLAQALTDKILRLLEKSVRRGQVLTTRQIRQVIEDLLMSFPFQESAKAYILSREYNALFRDITSRFDVDLIERYLKMEDWQVKENSNVTFSLQGLYHYLTGEASKMYWLKKIYPSEVAAAHLGGDFHIHTLGFLGVYCVGWDLEDLLKSGFRGASGKSESRPAKHFRAALGQIVNFFYTLQGESAGAQAFSNLDTLLSPFIRADRLSYADVKQALQEFVFNMNIPTRAGLQPPFTNITLDVNAPSFLAKEPVVIAGEPQKLTYGAFQQEMDIFNKALAEVMLEGDAKGRAFTFPIPTYNISKDFDWDNPVLSNIWAMTAKYGIPYFANFINSDMKPEDARSMCCRLRIDTRELNKRGGGFFGSAPLTGSIGVVTINMPRLGFISKSEENFFQKLERLMDLAKDSLEIKRIILEQFTEGDLYPYMKFYLRDIKKRFGRYWSNHFSTIGLVGMNEACQNLLGASIGMKNGQEFSLRVLDFMRRKLLQYQQETGVSYNLEATPAEGATYRLAKLDKQRYPEIICANESEFHQHHEPFYTNSTHLPVNFSDDVFEVLELQDELQSRYTGGTVLHIFLGEKITNTEGLKSLIRHICSKYKIPYFTITPTFSVCPHCGYSAGEHYVCLECGHDCEVFSRVVGYLRPVAQWNPGKQEEFRNRRVYKSCI
jgi:ribonucleoside-triphosphate reductase